MNRPKLSELDLLTEIDLEALLECYERNPRLPLFQKQIVTCLRELQYRRAELCSSSNPGAAK